MRHEIRLVGIGGQGLIRAGMILASAFNGLSLNCAVSEYISAQVKGGPAKTDIIVSDKPIYFPKARSVDILIALHNRTTTMFISELVPNSYIFLDSTYIKEIPEEFSVLSKRIFLQPFAKISLEKFGSPLYGNTIALAYACSKCNLLKIDDFKAIIPENVPKRFVDKNFEAVDIGFNLES
jgi:2-oxoglutarate ferredoxin oxidoreductase subunit gamma